MLAEQVQTTNNWQSWRPVLLLNVIKVRIYLKYLDKYIYYNILIFLLIEILIAIMERILYNILKYCVMLGYVYINTICRLTILYIYIILYVYIYSNFL